MKKIFVIISLLIFPILVNAKEIDKDITSGIILSSEEDILPNDTVLSVSSVNDTNVASVAQSFGFKNYKSYKISLLENNTRIIPNGEVTLSFPIPNNYNINFPKEIYILTVGNDGNAEVVYATYHDDIGLYEDMTINNGYAIINTSDFKLDSDTIFLIGTTIDLVNQTSSTTTTTIKTTVTNPETYDSGFTTLLIVTIICIGGVMVLFTKWYLDNKN